MHREITLAEFIDEMKRFFEIDTASQLGTQWFLPKQGILKDVINGWISSDGHHVCINRSKDQLVWSFYDNPQVTEFIAETHVSCRAKFFENCYQIGITN
jgi:hypothetical protein